jgi:hypothetical protein
VRGAFSRDPFFKRDFIGDPAIRNFLLMNKFSVESTKQKIGMYYTMRTLLPDLYGNPTCPQIKDFMDDMYELCNSRIVLHGSMFQVCLLSSSTDARTL